MSSMLVVFYSWGENTKAVAEYIRERIGADMVELKVQDEYPTDYNACVSKVGKDGRSYEPRLASLIPDLKQYRVLFVGSPCWWGTIANPLRTFLQESDLSGKKLAPFMTHGTSGLHVQDVGRICPKAKITKALGIYNKYQVSTKVNSISNIGDYNTLVDRWLEEISEELDI